MISSQEYINLTVPANDLIGGRATVLESFSQRSKDSDASLSETQERNRKMEWTSKIAQKSTGLTDLAVTYLASRGLYEYPGRYIRSGEAKDPESGKVYPALQAFAKDAQGKVTGGQHILLDPESGQKAEVSVKKRSFGVIKGSFVEVQQDSKNTGRTFIAEGVETALSLRQAGVVGKIVATLGVHNFKNYVPQESEKTIILCGDNDGSSSKTGSFKILNDTAKELVENQGKEVIGAYPSKVGDDFNDVLQKSGAQGVLSILQKARVPLSVSPELKQPTVASQESSQKSVPAQKEIESPQLRDLYSLEAIKEISFMQVLSRLTRCVENIKTCRNDSEKEPLEKNLHRFVNNIRESAPHLLSIYASRQPDFNKTLESVCAKVDHQIKQEITRTRGPDMGL